MAREGGRMHRPRMLAKVGPVTVSVCAYCNASHTRHSSTCSESCARGYRRRGKQARADVASASPVVAMGMGALLDLGVALVALEEARDLLPDESESELLNLFEKLPPSHRGALVDGLRRAVAKIEVAGLAAE